MSEELKSYVDDSEYDGPCKLCSQFVQKSVGNIFHKIFGNDFDPVIKEYKYFLWVVGLGQLYEGYTLLIPRRCIFSFSQLNSDEWGEFNLIFNEISNQYNNNYSDKFVIFEHGCEDSFITSGSCISHAHLHLMPYGNYQKVSDQLKKLWQVQYIEKLSDLSKHVTRSNPYLLYGISGDDKFLIIKDTYNIESQYFRKLLYSFKKGLNNWNWKDYIGKKEILRTISNFKSTY